MKKEDSNIHKTKAIDYEPLLCGVNKNEYINLCNTGEFYESLENKIIHTAKNRGGGTVVVGLSDKPNAT